MKTLAETNAERSLQEAFAELLKLAISTEGSAESRKELGEFYIKSAQQAIKMLGTVKEERIVGKYSNILDLKEAWRTYLEDRGFPATVQEIFDGIFGNGFAGGDRERWESSVGWSLWSHLTGSAKNNLQYGLYGDMRGLIGLREWGPIKQDLPPENKSKRKAKWRK